MDALFYLFPISYLDLYLLQNANENILILLVLRGLGLMSEPGSSVSIVSGYGLDDRVIEVRSSVEAKGFFLQPLCPYRLWGPPSLLFKGYRGSFPRAKARPESDTDHSSPSSAEVVNE
jgi:hypothetical protein